MDGARKLEAIFTTIEALQHRLEATVDEGIRYRLYRELAVARAAACLAEEEDRLEKSCADPERDVRRWRMRAEEYRALSAAAHDDSAQVSFRNLADSYEQLAERVEAGASEKNNL